MRNICRLAVSLVAMTAAAPVAASWHQATSPHFIVYSDDDAADVAAFTTDLERYDRLLRITRNVPDDRTPAQRVTIFVVRDKGAVARLAGSGSVAGFYQPRVEGSVAFVPRLGDSGSVTALSPTAILQHEYAHHFMYDSWGGNALPPWFVEGFAEFNATAKVIGSALTLGAPPLYRVYGLLDSALVPIKLLLTGSPAQSRMTQEQTHVFYGRAWLLTHYLTFDPARRSTLDRYLTALNQGTGLEQAAALLGDPKKLDADLNRYARSPRLNAAGLPLDRLPATAVAVRALTPGEAAMMPVRVRSARGVDTKTAPDVAAAARRIAAAYPADAAVQVTLAEAEYDTGRYEEADAAAARALAADPAMTRAMMYRGMAQGRIAARDKVNDPERWRAVRRWFTRANAVNPDDPWPLVAFYQAYLIAGMSPTRNAEDGLLTAHRLARYDRRVSLIAAKIALSRDQPDAAKRALRTVAFDPHGGPLSDFAGRILSLLDSAGRESATTALEGGASDEAEDSTAR